MSVDRLNGAAREGAGRELEDPQTIRLKIRYYQELLQFGRQTAEARGRVIQLLADAHEQLPLAEAAAGSRNLGRLA